MHLLLVLGALSKAAATPSGYVELAGSGGLGSVNLTAELRPSVDLRVGLSILPIDGNKKVVVIVPVMAELHTPGRWQAVAGAGLGPSITLGGAPWARGLLSAGGRYVPPDGHVWAGVVYTPFVSFLLDLQLQHWAGVQVGWRP